jgi:hypothetical protein
VQQVRRVRENESLDFRQPGEQKFLPLAEDRRDLRTLGSQDGEDWLFDADRIFPRKRISQMVPVSLNVRRTENFAGWTIYGTFLVVVLSR